MSDQTQTAMRLALLRGAKDSLDRVGRTTPLISSIVRSMNRGVGVKTRTKWWSVERESKHS